VAIHNIDHARDEEMRQLRADLAAASTHCSQLEEANRAWQQYQHDQVEAFRQRLQPEVPALDQTENASLDSMAQQILNQLNELHIERENLRRQMDYLKEEVQAQKQKLGKKRSKVTWTYSMYNFSLRSSRLRRKWKTYHFSSISREAVARGSLQTLPD
jgi:chromosome segregation ATPase